jgi:hypothetical protein
LALKPLQLGKDQSELWDDGALACLNERFQWLLQSPGLGLLTGEAGVGKTAALRRLTHGLNPHRYQTIYLAETDFGRPIFTVVWLWNSGLNPLTGELSFGEISRHVSRNWPMANSCYWCGSSMKLRIYP